MAQTKAMTQKYWKSLSKDSQKRALTHVFPTMASCVDMLLNDPKPNYKDDPWWKLVFKKVRQPIPTDYDKKVGYMHYKTVVNGAYIC